MPVPSQPPPSEQIPGHSSGGGLYLVGALALIGAAVALFSWKRCSSAPTTSQATSVTATGSSNGAPPKVEAPFAQFAPPPPPKLEEEDAGVDAGKPTKTTGGGTGVPALGPCGGNCEGGSRPAP